MHTPDDKPAAAGSARRITALLLLSAGPLVYLSFGFTEMAGSDLWWHLAAGRELVQTGTPWMVDDWSYSAHGRDWLNHEWLADLVFSSWASLWGVPALVYWKWLVIAATFTLLQLALARESGSPLAGFLCAATAAAIAAPFLDLRPHLYSLLGYSLLLYWLLGRRARPVPLALLFVLWVNLHGGFFFGLMVLAVLLFPWRDYSAQRLRAAVLVGLVCAGAALLNPSGVGSFLYPLKYAFDDASPFRTLAEWLPPAAPGGIRSPLFFAFQWAPLAALAYLLPPVRRRTGMPWEGILLAGLTLAMALTSRRFIPIFAVSLAVLLAPLLGVLLARLRTRAAEAGLAALCFVFAVWRMLPYPLQAAPAFHYLAAEYSYPVDTVNFMQANALQGRVFAYYNWGGYLHWRTDGALKVYIDGRADTLYDAETYNNYVYIMRSAPGWIERMEAGKPDFVLWPHARGAGSAKLRELLDTGRWLAVHRDARSWLLARADYPLPRPPQPAPETPWRDTARAWVSALEGDVDAAVRHSARARQAMPWNQIACDLAVRGLRVQGEVDRAGDVLAQCRRYFPSRTLR